jgi:uncharacterized protein
LISRQDGTTPIELTCPTYDQYAYMLMSTELPHLIDPWRAADSNAAFDRHLPIAGFERLAGSLADASGEVAFQLCFDRDEAGRAVVRAAVQATLLARCQRCLESVAVQVDSRVLLAVVTDLVSARQLPEQYDPLMAEEGMVRLSDVIEDELLLALPQIPRHAPGACSVAIEQPAAPRRENPFAVLAKLKPGERP